MNALNLRNTLALVFIASLFATVANAAQTRILTCGGDSIESLTLDQQEQGCVQKPHGPIPTCGAIALVTEATLFVDGPVDDIFHRTYGVIATGDGSFADNRVGSPSQFNLTHKSGNVYRLKAEMPSPIDSVDEDVTCHAPGGKPLKSSN